MPEPGRRPALARAHPERFMWAWENVGMSAASGILDDVTYDWLHLVEAMAGSGGSPLTVSEEEVVEAHRLVHAHTAIDADATGSSGLAGVVHACRRHAISAGEHVVVLVTGIARRAPTPG
jgi:threonine synthase